MIEPLQWIFLADRLPDADQCVLLWLQAPDGTRDWDVGHLDADGWVLDWCGSAPAGQVLAWAELAGPDAIATLLGSGRDVLEDLQAAAAATWRGNPAAQRAGLFARAADEVARLRAAVAVERQRLRSIVRHHFSQTTMSLYGTQPECKAARDALQRLLDDLA